MVGMSPGRPVLYLKPRAGKLQNGMPPDGGLLSNDLQRARRNINSLFFIPRYGAYRQFRPAVFSNRCNNELISKASLKCGLRGKVGKVFEARRNSNQPYCISDSHEQHWPPLALRLCVTLRSRITRLGIRLRLRLRLFLDGEKFHFEDQRGVGSYYIRPPLTRAALAISQVRRHKQFPLGTNWHKLQRFRPTFDHLADRKCRGLAALVGAIEFGAIYQHTFIVALNLIGSCRLRAGSCLQDLVLQTAREGDYAFLRLIGGKKLIACCLVCSGGSGRFRF